MIIAETSLMISLTVAVSPLSRLPEASNAGRAREAIGNASATFPLGCVFGNRCVYRTANGGA